MSTWWILPRAVEVNSDTHYGVVDSVGNVAVIEIENSGSTVTRHELGTAIQDDHCAPAILVPADKPPIAIWTRHAANSLLYLRRGNGDPEDWTSLIAEETETIGTNCSYSQIYREGLTDHVVIFTRYGSGNDEWGVIESTDYGATWSSVQTVFDFENNQGYISTVQVGDIIRVVTWGHPTLSAASHREPRYFEIDLSDGDITDNDGNSVGNLDGTSLPLDVNSYTEIVNFTNDQRVFDVSSGTEPAVVVGEWTTDIDTEYKFLVRQSAATPTWTKKDIVAAGVVFGEAASRHYNGGASFINPDDDYTMYLAREDSGTWYIDKYETDDDGDSWTVTNVTSSDISQTHAHIFARPYCPVNAGSTATVAGPEVIWHAVNRYTSFTDYAAALRSDQTVI